MAVTYTARTKATMARATNASQTTTSTTYVDMTGISLASTPNNYYYSAYFNGTQGGASTTLGVKLVEGATDKKEILCTPQPTSAANHVAWFADYQNTSGSAQTIKLQWKISSGTANAYANTCIYSFSTNTLQQSFMFSVNGKINIPIKASLASMDFLVFSAGYGQNKLYFNLKRNEDLYVNVSTSGQTHNTTINAMGMKSHSSMQNTETDADAIPTVTINNIVTGGIEFTVHDSDWQGFFNNNVTTPTDNAKGFVALIYDWTGTQIMVT